MARGGLELCALGHCLFPVPFSGEVDLREMAGAEQIFRSCLHAFADSCHMGDFWNFGYGTAYGVSGKSDRLSQRRDSGREDAACQVFKGVCATFNNMRCFYNALAGKTVLEVEGSLVYSTVPACCILVVGI